jgi:hypothetical protein
MHLQTEIWLIEKRNHRCGSALGDVAADSREENFIDSMGRGSGHLIDPNAAQ